MQHAQERTCSHYDELIQHRQLPSLVFHWSHQVDDQRLQEVNQRENVILVEELILEEVFEGANPQICLESDEKENTRVDEAVILPIVLHQK